MFAVVHPVFLLRVPQIVDISSARIEQWNSDVLPIYEPGLDDVVKKCRGRNLFFTEEVDQGIREATIIFVAVNTPTKKIGIGAGRAADLTYWELAARRIAAVADTPKIVVEKSTVPIKTAEAISSVLHAAGRTSFSVLSNPEFLAEGTAMDDLERPDRVLIGGPLTEAGADAIERLAQVYAHWVSIILRTFCQHRKAPQAHLLLLSTYALDVLFRTGSSRKNH